MFVCTQDYDKNANCTDFHQICRVDWSWLHIELNYIFGNDWQPNHVPGCSKIDLMSLGGGLHSLSAHVDTMLLSATVHQVITKESTRYKTDPFQLSASRIQK